MPTGPPTIDSRVDQRGLDILVSKKLFSSFEVAGVCIEQNLCAEMTELMRGHDNTRPPSRVPADQVSDCGLCFGRPVWEHEQTLRTMADVLGRDVVPIFQ